MDNYNNLVLEKLFSSNEIFDVALDTNASDCEDMQQWIKILILTTLRKL